MTLIIDGHSFAYEMENLCRLFFPREEIRTVREESGGERFVYTGIKKENGGILLTVRTLLGNSARADSVLLPAGTDEPETERRMAETLWRLLAEECGVRPAWGILTGVRPLKLFSRLADEQGEESAEAYFREKLLVSPEKTELARAAWRNQKALLAQSKPDGFSLYVSIPFCPTRCAYCSFVSSSVEKAARLIPEYVELLCREIRRTGEIVSGLKLKMQSVYFGGGTPTVLSAEQLSEVIRAVRESFSFADCREFTVEAGRPDTVTQERLDALRAGGVTRISINPQTLSDEVLAAIGRRHTTAQTFAAFELARRNGFGNINMDLIAGLPKDTPEGFRNTVSGVLRLAPESITVHTLALKRAARLNHEETPSGFQDGSGAGEMISHADAALTASGYRPYYLYRQSRMLGNQENTGWAKPGYESLYNVYIMEECQTILACGAGAVTKLCNPSTGRIERIFNFKYPYEYNGRFGEMMNRKEQVIGFYDSVGGPVCNVPQQRGGDQPGGEGES